MPAFAELAAAPDPPLDLLALALAAEFGPVDVPGAVARLDDLGEELAGVLRPPRTAEAEASACAVLLGTVHGFRGDRKRYDEPANAMLDRVLARRRGLPILLSVVYVEVARRAGVELRGVGLPGHFVVGHFARTPPFLIDPFSGGARIDPAVRPDALAPWTPHEIAMRILNNLVASFGRRGDLARGLRAAGLRLQLPAAPALRDTLEAELRVLQARLN